MSPDFVDGDAAAAATKQRRVVRPFSVFLVGWAVIGALSMVAMYVAVVTLASPELLESRPGAAGGTWLWSAQYTGETKFGRRIDAAATGQSNGAESFEALRLTLQHDLAGRHAVRQVAEELKLLEGLPHDEEGGLTREGQMARNAIVRDLMARITITWEVQSRNIDLVAVRVTHPNAKLAKLIPDALVTNYINRVSERTVMRLANSRDFLKEQVRWCRQRVNDAAMMKAKFETAHADAMPSNPGALNERINKITSEIEALRIREETAKLTLSRLNELRPTSQPTSRPTSRPARRPTLQPETRPTGEPNLVLKQVIMGPNPELGRLKDQLRRLKQEVESVTREIRRLRKRLEPLLALMKNFARIRQDYTTLVETLKKERQELDSWEKRYTAVQMDLQAEVAKRRTHLHVVQAAEEPEHPDTLPLVAFMATVAVAIGAIGGIILALLARLLNRRSARRVLA